MHKSQHYSPPSSEAENSYKGSSVLIVDHEPGIREFLQKGLHQYFGLVETAKDIAGAEILRQRCHFDLIISDIRLPDKSGVTWVTELRKQGGTTSVIFITAHANLETAIAALQAGASDFIIKPFSMQQMLASIQHTLAQQHVQRENLVLKRQVEKMYSGSIIGNSVAMKNVSDVLEQVAPMPTTVLIEGESGTGKELAARAVHEMSGRSGSFVPINCGAISEELMESELFGHTKGAFTSAQQAREGLFTYADGGTLFLDEIGEMPLSMQVHLLRVIEERVIRPVGSNREIRINVRIIAATNRNLNDLVKAGQFREDLYYRLNVVNILIPPLRDRKDDLPLLVQHFVTTIASELGIDHPEITGSDLYHLRAYAWPGNIRELKNVIERCLLLNKGPRQCIDNLANKTQTGNDSCNEPEAETLASVEKQHIMKILNAENGNNSAAARRLGISRKTMERKLKQWRSEKTASEAS